jgi:ATP-dependent RNA helicase SUPV3L1/SUV3
MKRKIIYHAGPTNSGKTYSALLGFQKSESGVYCGPLKLLANEVYIKTNQAETACDLVTGEERKFANETGQPANHVACTVEMCNLEREYEVAVIDEIQMIKDGQRGWAWTRAFLGVRAKEIHVCGDMSAVGLITELTMITGDEIEVRNYQRLTPLTVEDHELGTFDKLLPGDCIVCFNKNDIYQTVSLLEKKGHEVAVVYGSMPPGVKLI